MTTIHKWWFVRFLIVAVGFCSFVLPILAIDLNSNHQSDVWEALYSTQNLPEDADGDGKSNEAESVAGSDPRDAFSFFKVEIAGIKQEMETIRWPSVLGKTYTVEVGSLVDGWIPYGQPMAGTGAPMEMQIPVAAGNFSHVIVADRDTDGDGVTDWEELQLGLNPALPETIPGIDDLSRARALLTSPNLVTIEAIQADASEVGPQVGKFRIARTGGVGELSIPYSVGGTAISGIDYPALPGVVKLPFAANSAIITVEPIRDNVAESVELVTLTLQPQPSFSIVGSGQASLTISDSTNPAGSGLKGEYQDTASKNYLDAVNFAPSTLKETRVDPVVNFNWAASAPFPSMGVDTFSVRWTGQVQPQYSEDYTFSVSADDGVKLWVNQVLVIDKWVIGSGTYTGAISLKAGVRYDIKLEFLENTGNAFCQLSWYSANQIKQIIPQNRLYSAAIDTVAPSAITSNLEVIAFINRPFSYQISGSNGANTFSAGALPSGLILDSLGRLGGIPTQAGRFRIPITAANSIGAGAAILNLSVLDTGMMATRDQWNEIPGAEISSIPLGTPPTETGSITRLESMENVADNFGTRLRGFITAPETGNYYFWIAGSDAAQLWLSNSAEPAEKMLRAWTTSATAAHSWTESPQQKSAWLAMVAGQRYYFEVLQKAGAGLDHVAVGWALPSAGNNPSGPTEVVPGYVLSPFTETSSQAGERTLFLANLTPQAGNQSTGSGTATLRLSADEKNAIIQVQYGNLSSPVTGGHIHDASRSGAIIFDLDDEKPDANGDIFWTIAPTGTLSAADVLQTIKAGNGYVNIHTANHPEGEIKGDLKQTVGSVLFTPPAAPPRLIDRPPTAAEAARFLGQASFGPSPPDIQQLQNIGFESWLDQQFSLSPTSLRQAVTDYYSAFPVPSGASRNPSGLFNAWWKNSITAPDQLRQRVALALSEILVISQQSGSLYSFPDGSAEYYDILLRNSFGNFRNLLEEATLNPAMGRYLDMLGNDKPNFTTGFHPNENFSREVMQLFTIGLQQLQPDGSLKLDSQGLPLSTYHQSDVVGLAHVFTGWKWHQTGQSWSPPSDFLNPMTLVDSHHDLGAKPLLNNVVLQANQGGAVDLKEALDLIFDHPNVGPFLAHRLIQHLVTSNPSPAYVYRVASVFNDDGNHVRGNLQAVIRAILMDYEARSDAFADFQGAGRQVEPLVKAVAVFRAHNAFSNNGSFTMGSTDSDLAQSPLYSPSVFNFFQPDYSNPGEIANAGLYSPEFQITSETSTVRACNFFYNGIFSSNGIVNDSAKGFHSDLEIDPTKEKDLASNPEALVDYLNGLLMAGEMPPAMKTQIVGYLSSIAVRLGTTNESADRLTRARSAIHLIVTSPQFTIQR